MLVYAHRTTAVDVAGLLPDFRRRAAILPVVPGRGLLVDFLVDVGTVASAVADRLSPEADDDHAAMGAWHEALAAIADGIAAAWHGEPGRLAASPRVIAAAVARLSAAGLAGSVAASTPEGFACWAVMPEQYVAAADDLVRARQPARAFVLGLRGIGLALAETVGGALRHHAIPTLVRSARPHGPPFERRLALAPALAQRILAFAPSHVVIVDEGPGLSGSSFAGAVDAMLAIGIPADRIVLCPSHHTDGSQLRSPRAREVWRRHARFVTTFEETFRGREGPLPAGDGVVDLSAGRWRPVVLGADRRHWPAVQPQHERRKYLSPGAPPTVTRFAGLGRLGQHKLERAHLLAAAGFGPRPLGLAHGFLTLEWTAGGAAPAPAALTAWTARAADYLALLRTRCATTGSACLEPLADMLRVNAMAGLGGWTEAVVGRLCRNDYGEPAVAIDGRMLPHEWLSTGSQLLKTDALDHHADDFYPGCTDIAWDLAGAIVELDLDAAHVELLLARYSAASGDRTAAARLPFYHAAYLAYRLGYTTLAGATLGAGDHDGAAFIRAASRYRRSLAARLAPQA